MTQSLANIDDEREQLFLGSMHGRQIQRCLSCMFDRSPKLVSNIARLVMASMRAPGLAARPYHDHQL